MKKVATRVVFLLLFLFLVPLDGAAAAAPDAPSCSARLNEEYNAFFQSVPPEVRDLLPETLLEAELASAEEDLRREAGIRAVLTSVGQVSGIAILQALALLAQIAGVLLLCATVRALVPNEKGGTGRAFSLCSTLCLTLLLFSSQRELFTVLEGFFDTVGQLSASLLPLLGTLYAMGGNVRVAVVNHGILSAFLAIVQTFCAGTASGIAGVSLSLALLDALAGGVSLKPLAGLIKRCYTLFLSFLMLLLCGVLGMQSTLAKAGDSLALRTARFAAGSFLPVVGGSVSESLRTVAGSVEYLRSLVGTGAVAVLFFAFLPTFFHVLFTRLAFLLGGSCARLLQCEGAQKLLEELAAVYGYFLAIIASLFVTLVFSLTLFARCAAG